MLKLNLGHLKKQLSELKHISNELRFELVRVLAERSMDIVYEFEQKGADHFVKRVEEKLIREEYSKIDEFWRNFFGEARLVGDLIHTNRKDRIGLVHSLRLEA